MTKNIKPVRPLQLATEIVRTLDRREMPHVVGGTGATATMIQKPGH